MKTRITALAVLALAAAVAAGPAVAATTHKAASKGSTASADNSADQLNATSLSDAKSNTPYAPAPAPSSDAKPAAAHGKKAATKS